MSCYSQISCFATSREERTNKINMLDRTILLNYS